MLRSMAFGYTNITSETLDLNQVRVVQGYDISGEGTILQIRVTEDLGHGYYAKISCPEIFVPGWTVAGITGKSFYVLRTEDLTAGATRITRAYNLLPGVVVHTINLVTIDTDGTNRQRVVAEEMYYVPNTMVSGTDLITYVP